MSFGISFTQAVYTLVFICDKTSLGRHDLISTSTISEVLTIPKPSVVKILKALNRAGITGSGIGKKGGVSILRAPKDISFLDIFLAIEGEKPLFRSDHNFTTEGLRHQETREGLSLLLNSLDESFHSQLQEISLSRLTRKRADTQPLV